MIIHFALMTSVRFCGAVDGEETAVHADVSCPACRDEAARRADALLGPRFVVVDSAGRISTTREKPLLGVAGPRPKVEEEPR
jgi:hypothetical protein